MKHITAAINESLKRGWSMSKQISPGSSGFFSYTPPTYDTRKVYNAKDLQKLNSEGFSLDNNAGLLALNILLSLHTEEDKKGEDK